jgi:hypothetical protein
MRQQRGTCDATLQNYGLDLRNLLKVLGEDPARFDAESLRKFVLGRSQACGWAARDGAQNEGIPAEAGKAERVGRQRDWGSPGTVTDDPKKRPARKPQEQFCPGGQQSSTIPDNRFPRRTFLDAGSFGAREKFPYFARQKYPITTRSRGAVLVARKKPFCHRANHARTWCNTLAISRAPGDLTGN